MHMKKSTKTLCSCIALALLVGFLLYMETLKTTQGMAVSILQKGAIFSIAAVSMNLLNGFTGLFSLGQAGFMAIGAYVTAIFTIPTEKIVAVYYMNGVSEGIMSIKRALSFLPEPVLVLLALIAGGLVAAGFAALVGIPVLRLKSDYLAIATLGFSEIIRALISSPQMDKITNGSYGLKNIPGFGGENGLGCLLVPFGIAALCIVIMVLLIRSSYGRAFKAIAEDEVAAEAMGINLAHHKEMAFVISSFFTAVAGGLLAMYMRSIEAKTFQVILTYDILLIVVIGGIGSVTGSVIGAFLVTASKEWWLRFFDTPLKIGNFQVPLLRTGFRMVIFSLLLMAVVLFWRRGLMGNREFNWDDIPRFGRWVKRKFTKTPATEGGERNG
jgi:branched-chain amino acid transport system permease protein